MISLTETVSNYKCLKLRLFESWRSPKKRHTKKQQTMINRLKVKGLNGKLDFDITFNEDINLLTGKNGTGKTTILKLIWYLNGGYIANLLTEVNFQEIELDVNSIKILVKRTELKNERGINWEFKIEPDRQTFKDVHILPENYSFQIKERQLRNIEYTHPSMFGQANILRDVSMPTLFFPTFRRIEGGFSMEDNNKFGNDPFARNPIKQSLQELSQRFSFHKHKFISSISTDDLVQLITSEYATKTAKFNQQQKELSDKVINSIKERKNKNDSELLASIQSDIEQLENERTEHFKPFTVLSDLITQIFQHKGIKLNNLTIGDISNSISSEKLSAGEKQMLSFICYNTFIINSAIFIDEPELSLHPDWQRILLPTLLRQNDSNQYFMATHSPFIYTKYQDKEIIISEDKG